MELTEIIDTLSNNGIFWGVLIFLAGFIKIPKIELNIWNILGKQLTKAVDDKIDELDRKISKVEFNLDHHIESNREDIATSARTRILRFNDEIINGQNHAKEHWEDVLFAIDKYERYCQYHPDYSNNRCMLAIENIKESYVKINSK